MKPLRYFFLRNYELNLKQRSAMPWFRPLVLVSVLSGLNVLVVVWVWAELWGGPMTITQRESALKVITALCGALMFFALYFRWISSGRYLTFRNEFSDESRALRKIRTALLFAYGIGSLCAPAIAGYWTFLRR